MFLDNKKLEAKIEFVNCNEKGKTQIQRFIDSVEEFIEKSQENSPKKFENIVADSDYQRE
ncbi:hypothetical protein [Clostridium uliginosum]|uniref:Uncharacterized protein n=1 Tax=Clostridium uliginosum TaxID=119641 RepID=A0A1I1KJ15_9CLOT|nr:hypothetical protein [Clostridium uliginosum]SFC60974.1 hypothetical protein SAMN05421842_10640 [Clostridium uliginosum]